MTDRQGTPTPPKTATGTPRYTRVSIKRIWRFRFWVPCPENFSQIVSDFRFCWCSRVCVVPFSGSVRLSGRGLRLLGAGIQVRVSRTLAAFSFVGVFDV
jgi:hypothetical protein